MELLIVTRRRASADSVPDRTSRDPIPGAVRPQQSPPRPAPGLYLVATPIGNLADITLRALDVLRGADRIFCEDTRVTRKLTGHYAIDVPLEAYNDHNGQRVLPRVMERLRAGERIALVSDAGTPLISDPGYRLVQAARAEDLPVFPVPGPVAAVAALTVAGLPTDSFFFAGFLPPKAGARRRRLAELAAVPATIVFYEAPQRVVEALADMAETLGDRPAAVARELTKLHEEVRRGSLADLAEALSGEAQPRGEIVLVVGPPAADAADDAQIDAMLERALGEGSLRDAVQQVASVSGRSRQEVYRMALALTKGGGKDTE